MSEPLRAGVFDEGSSYVVIRVCVWQPPQFGQFDEKMQICPRLRPMQPIFVVRRAGTRYVGTAEVRWENGDDIGQWARKRLPKWLRNRIEQGIADTLRIAGGGRRSADSWYEK